MGKVTYHPQRPPEHPANQPQIIILPDGFSPTGEGVRSMSDGTGQGGFRGIIDGAVPARLKKTAMRVVLVVGLVWLANVGATVVWSGRNPCLRSHTEYASHPDPNGDNVIEVCDWYKTDPGRNPWYPSNEFRTLENVLTH